MKCKKCGYVARTISGMAKHYRLKHPGSMKHGPRGKAKKRSMKLSKGMAYCPMCGKRID